MNIWSTQTTCTPLSSERRWTAYKDFGRRGTMMVVVVEEEEEVRAQVRDAAAGDDIAALVPLAPKVTAPWENAARKFRTLATEGRGSVLRWTLRVMFIRGGRVRRSPFRLLHSRAPLRRASMSGETPDAYRHKYAERVRKCVERSCVLCVVVAEHWSGGEECAVIMRQAI